MSRAEPSRRTAVLRSVLFVAVGAGLLWWTVPKVSGVAWSVLRASWGEVTVREVALLTVVWLAGLIAHTFVLTGALPGLTHRRALTLNLTGSAVANVAPMGGALGVATNLHMVRTWRFSDSAFAVFTVVTNIWDVLAKLALPMLALVGIVVAGDAMAPHLQVLAVVAVAVLAGLVGVMALAVARPAVGGVMAHALARRAARLLPRRWAHHAVELDQRLLAALESTRGIVRERWRQLTAGMAAYVALQFLLFWLCLHVLGVTMSPALLLAGFAVERLLTLAVVTPGGTGIAEAGGIATLVAMGGDPLAVAAGLLLYRGFTFLIEIPVGGVWLAAWLLQKRTVTS